MVSDDQPEARGSHPALLRVLRVSDRPKRPIGQVVLLPQSPISRDPATAHLTTADWQLLGPVAAAAGTPSGALARAKEGVTPVPDHRDAGKGGTELVDTLLLAAIAIVLAGGVFIVVLDGWRRWSDIRKHLRK